MSQPPALSEHVHYLSSTIGPRGTGTPAEQQAADYAAGCLAQWGIPMERLTCRTIQTMNHYPLAINAMGLAAFCLYPLGGGWTRWAAAVRALLAHLDSNKCRLIWKPERLKTLEPLTYTTLLGDRWGAWGLSLVPGLYMLAIGATLILDDFTPYSPGANDNASSVGVVLDLAQELSQAPLQRTRLWLAFTGAEETDHFGLRSVLAAHPHELRQALFIDLEGVGGGDLIYVTRHGIGLHYTPDPALVSLAAQVCRDTPGLEGIGGAQMTVSEEVSTLTHLGYRALCIAGLDRATHGLTRWRLRSDTYENLNLETLAKARQFVKAMVIAIDNGS